MTDVRVTSRIAGLDGLRGLAALFVVFSHYLSRGPSLYPGIGLHIPWLEFGGRGVELFFLISGFVIVRSVSRGSLGRFATARFIRLYPLYWLCLTITFVVVSIFSLPGREVPFAPFLVNFSMFQGYLGVANVDGAYWTLAVELAFYFQIAVLWGAGVLRKHPAATLLIWVGSCLSIRLVAEIDSLPFANLPGIYTLNWMPWFICGVALSYAHNGCRAVGMLAVIPLSVLGVSVFSVRDGLYFALFVLLMCFVLFVNPCGMNARPLLWLGSISYALYLLHQNVGYVIMRESAIRQSPAWLGLMAAILIVVLLSWIVTRFVDTPVRGFLNRKLVK